MVSDQTIFHCLFCCVSFVFVSLSYIHIVYGLILVLSDVSHSVNREAVPLVHTLCIVCFLFFSSHTPLSFERESSETILLFSDSGGSEVGWCEDSTRVTVLV